MFETHFFYKYKDSKGASRLPVLALYAIYTVLLEELNRFNGKALKPLEAHSAADAQTGAIGDIDFYLVDELELMLKTFPEVVANIRKSAREVADEIKSLRVDIIHGHAYYYDFANDHNIQYYMLKLDKLIECMNLKLVGFNDSDIKSFHPY